MKKKHLITSALPYINGIKHLGNLAGSLLPADVYTRYLKQQGEEAAYICGTDEHGTPAELAALEHQEPIDIYCQKMYATQKAIYERFSLEFDYFGRSSSPANHKMTQMIFKALDQEGYIETRQIRQIYSKVDGRFLPDRYVTGTCPKCGYEKARGDQCDGCGSLLDPTDLLHPRSSLSGSSDLEIRESAHLFLRLDALQKEVAAWVENHQDWPNTTKGIAFKWLQEGLQARCISRDLDWGVKIPKAGFEHKVFYVWFDAPIAYISMTQEWAAANGKSWQTYWENTDQVQYTQFMAKDNVPFHTVFFPAMILGSRLNLKLPDQIKAFNWLNYEGGKFSTSLKRGIFSDQALELFPADYWRYYLIANAPESADSDFSFAHFAEIINKDLADVLGNFLQRVSKLVHQYFEGKIPEAHTPVPMEIQTTCQKLVSEMDQALKELKFRQAAQTLRAIWALGNEYIAKAEPWKTAKTDLAATGSILNHCLHFLRIDAIMAAAILPNTAKIIFDSLGEHVAPHQIAYQDALDWQALPAGRALHPHPILFAKIPKETVTALTNQFSGIS